MQMSAECWQLFHFATLPGLGFAVVILRCANVKLIDAKPRARGGQRPRLRSDRLTFNSHFAGPHLPLSDFSPAIIAAWHADVARSN